MQLNHKTEQKRQSYLDWLYQQSGRANGLYTGLYQERIKELVEIDMVAALNQQRKL